VRFAAQEIIKGLTHLGSEAPHRNRVTLERNFSIRNYRFAPYLRGELFYESRFDKIAKDAFTVGGVFPITKRTEFELY
jgi:hypothetical protein